jgi:hypothetical protein
MNAGYKTISLEDGAPHQKYFGWKLIDDEFLQRIEGHAKGHDPLSGHPRASCGRTAVKRTSKRFRPLGFHPRRNPPALR